MKEYGSIFELLNDVRKIKTKIKQLKYRDCIIFRTKLYKIGFPEWSIDRLWEYVWDDKSYEEVFEIYFNNRNKIKNENYNRLQTRQPK